MISLRALLIASLLTGVARSAEQAPLELEAKIPLGDVHGRIDHMTVDSVSGRLFVAELGNNSVGVVDLRERRTLRTIAGLKQPQGLGYAASTGTLYVANGGDGTVRLFQGVDLEPAGRIALDEDADNVRVDDGAHRVIVGYGSGGLAVLGLADRQPIARIPLAAHPESFQLDPAGQRIFVNVPDAHQIAIVDRVANRQTASWPTGTLHANFPLALDPAHDRVIAVFRQPATVAVLDAQNGRLLASVATCGDADDVFLDPRRGRLYVICGEGLIETLAAQGDGYVSVGRIPTAAGARTGLFVPDVDRLLLAVRSTAAAPASIWIFRPAP